MNKWRYLGLVLVVLIAGIGVIRIMNSSDSTGDSEEVEVSKNKPNVTDFSISSPNFLDGEDIPAKFTCDGEDISPALDITGTPPNSSSLVLIVDDPDAPVGTANPGWVHWVVINIPTSVNIIKEGEKPTEATELQNDFQHVSYGGPCPPNGQHRYQFSLYALDIELDLAQTATKADVEASMDGHILAQIQLVGLYTKVSNL